jgi:hypothetical protein
VIPTAKAEPFRFARKVNKKTISRGVTNKMEFLA